MFSDTRAVNRRGSTRSCAVTTAIVDAAGATAVSNSTPATPIGAGDAETFERRLTVTNPRLRHPNSPYLYKVLSLVYGGDGGVFTDSCAAAVGIRTVSFSKNDGFRINGDSMILRGGNRHQDYPYVGNAARHASSMRTRSKVPW